MSQTEFAIIRLESLAGTERLAEVARNEGYRMVDRIRQEWLAGSNRFDKPDEFLLGAIADGRLVGVAGITHQGPMLGRIRRVFVDPQFRRRGIATALMTRLLEMAEGHYDELVLRTDNPLAAQFYEALGFAAEGAESLNSATHRRVCARRGSASLPTERKTL